MSNFLRKLEQLVDSPSGNIKQQSQRVGGQRVYVGIRHPRRPSSYLRLECKLSERKELVKVRIGNHKIRIETGRYMIDQIPRVNRICPICESNQTEGESHFLMHYDKYSI